MKNKTIRTAIEITIIILLVLTLIVSTIYINPVVTDDIRIQIDNPLETYTFNSSMNFSRITIASTYVVFNNTGFNITATQPVNVTIIDIDDNPLTAIYDELVVEFHTYSTGFITISLSGLLPNLQYSVYKDNISDSYPVANSTGCILFDPNSGHHNFKIYVAGDSTPPTVTINFAGNLSDSGGPYWRPPGESTQLTGVWSDGYYTNDSRQNESWIYINVTANDEYGISHVWLQWLNETTWTNYTYEFTNQTGGYFDINTSNNFTVVEGYNYSFNIVANDTGGNSKTVWWNKTAIKGGIIARRTVQLNCTPTNISYTPYYLFNAPSYTWVPGDALKHDRLHHDQGADGTGVDTGILTDDIPTDTINLRSCGSFLGYWFDESVCAESFTLNNIYYHFWWSSDETGNNINWTGYGKQRTYLNQTTVEYYSPKIADSPSTIIYDNDMAVYSNNYYLNAHLQTLDNSVDFTDNDIYEFVVKVSSVFPEAVHPTVISNRSIIGFILLNVPDNATLNASYADTDSDLLSDWTELYVSYTNPFLSDTDNDGETDYWEHTYGSDPNDYTNTVENQFPVISNVFPADGSTVSIGGSPVNAHINIPEGDTMNISIWSNHTGTWTRYAGYPLSESYNIFMNDADDDGDWDNTDLTTYTTNDGWQTIGDYGFYNNQTVTDDWGMTTNQTTYYWSINATDSYEWINETYYFITVGAASPTVTTNDVNEQYLDHRYGLVSGTIDNDGSYDCEVWFEYGRDNNYGNDTRYNISYRLDNESNWAYLMFNEYFWRYNDTIDSNISTVKFLTTTGLYDNVSIIFRLYDGSWTSWLKSLVGTPYNTLNEITPDGVYGFYLSQDTADFLLNWDMNVNYSHWMNWTGWEYMRFPKTLFDWNNSINNNDSVKNVLQTLDIYDDVDWVFDYSTDPITSWGKSLDPVYVTLHTLDYRHDYRIHTLNNTQATAEFDLKPTYNTGDTFHSYIYHQDGVPVHYRFVAENDNGRTNGTNHYYLSRPDAPDRMWVNQSDIGNLTVEWQYNNQIDGIEANNTYIERFLWGDTPYDFGTGTLVYNGTANTYNDTGLENNTRYIYYAYGWSNWSINDTSYNIFTNNSRGKSKSEITNAPPEFSNIFPVNNSIVDIGITISIYIEDVNADTFNWTIDTYPDIGNSSANNAVNGSKNCSITPSHNTDYIWYVNCTDGSFWTNRSYNFTAMVQYVNAPTDGQSKYVTGTQRLNLSWTGNTRADNYTVVQRNDTYATSATQSGNWIRQNDTYLFWNESWTETSGGYFTIFSYNATANMHSYNNETPLGLDIPWGALALSCFNENNPAEAIGFDIEISNSDFTTTYAATDLTNIVYIDMEDIPYGDDTIFLVSNSSFETRSYTYDIHQNAFYNLIFYLPTALPPGGSDDPTYDENTTYAENYVIHVVGPATEYGVDPPITDAEVIIRKYINTTEQYETVGVYITDADGTFTVSLLPDNLYGFNISATGYYSTVESWVPIEIVFESDRHHTFRLTPLSGEDIPGVDYDNFWDTITFTGVMNDIDGVNGTLTITYIDSNSSTTDTHIYIYEWNGTADVLIISISNTSENSFTYTTGVINTTRVHSAVLYFNNTANFDVDSPVSIQIVPINTWSDRTPFDMEERVTNILGPFDLKYENVIAVSIALIILCTFGVFNTGIGIIGCGLGLGITNFIFNVTVSNAFNPTLVVIVPLIIIIGGIYMLVKDPGGHL